MIRGKNEVALKRNEYKMAKLLECITNARIGNSDDLHRSQDSNSVPQFNDRLSLRTYEGQGLHHVIFLKQIGEISTSV